MFPVSGRAVLLSASAGDRLQSLEKPRGGGRISGHRAPAGQENTPPPGPGEVNLAGPFSVMVGRVGLTPTAG